MSFRKIRNSTPLIWKFNLFITALLVLVVGSVELVLEPLAKNLLADLYNGFQPWHEVVLWTVSIVIPSVVCSYLLSKIISTKLGRMAGISQDLARGNLNTRLPVVGNGKDAFDVLAQSFNHMAEAIENQINLQRRLIADISHELRTPLTNMTIAAELLPRRKDEQERAAVMQRLNKEITQMNDLVSSLLSQAKDNHFAAEIWRMVDLDEILQHLAADFSFQGKAHDKRVETTIQGPLKIEGNPFLLRRMIGNLLANAVFYTPPHSTVEIRAGILNAIMILTIRDYGPGVPEDQLEDIFRIFYRVDNSRARSSGGAGLGLALVREAVLAHKGSVKAENAKPGLILTVKLPAGESV